MGVLVAQWVTSGCRSSLTPSEEGGLPHGPSLGSSSDAVTAPPGVSGRGGKFSLNLGTVLEGHTRLGPAGLAGYTQHHLPRPFWIGGLPYCLSSRATWLPLLYHSLTHPQGPSLQGALFQLLLSKYGRQTIMTVMSLSNLNGSP